MTKTLFALSDRGNWGASLCARAVERGWSVICEGEPKLDGPVPDYSFTRINQGGSRMSREKYFYEKLLEAGSRMIMDPMNVQFYEDKVAQTQAYATFMPRSLVIFDKKAIDDALSVLSFPLVSKSRSGSASANVRIIRNEEEARQEADKAFSHEGLKAPHRLGEKKQIGYLIWQEFLEGNPYDYRVCKIGRKYMILRRHNREDVPFASGSGKTEPIKHSTSAEIQEVLAFSRRFFKTCPSNWCGIDLVKDMNHGGEMKLLETTIGWSAPAYADCVFFEDTGNPTRYRGHEIWQLLLDEINAGVFG